MEYYIDTLLKTKLFCGKTPEDFMWQATGGAYTIEIDGRGHTYEELIEPVYKWKEETSGEAYCNLYTWRNAVCYDFCVPR